MIETVTPRSFSEAATALAGAKAEGRPVRVTGAGTKLGWGGQTPAQALKLQTTHLNRVIVHDDDLETATLGAGTPMVRAQSLLARHGRMFAVDPQLGLGHSPAATVGGVVSTADSGPLSHRYGPVRDQIVGVTLALADGTVVRTGPRADDTHDGYELAKLVTGAFGTLGVVLAVDVRLHPALGRTATAIGTTSDTRVLHDLALELRRQRSIQALDIAWRGGQGGLLAQLAGEDVAERAALIADAMRAAGLTGTAVRIDDAALWARQRAGQRSADRALVRVHSRPTELETVLALADHSNATVVGRAALGIFYLTMNVNQIAPLREGLPDGASAVALDLPTSARGAVDPWALTDGPELELMRRIKRNFDPAEICNPGVFVGRI